MTWVVEVVQLSARGVRTHERWRGRHPEQPLTEAITSEYQHLQRGGPVQGFAVSGGACMWLESHAEKGLVMVRKRRLAIKRRPDDAERRLAPTQHANP